LGVVYERCRGGHAELVESKRRKLFYSLDQCVQDTKDEHCGGDTTVKIRMGEESQEYNFERDRLFGH